MAQSSMVMIVLMILCAINMAFYMAMHQGSNQEMKPLKGVITKTTIRKNLTTYLMIMVPINVICLMLFRCLADY